MVIGGFLPITNLLPPGLAQTPGFRDKPPTVTGHRLKFRPGCLPEPLFPLQFFFGVGVSLLSTAQAAKGHFLEIPGIGLRFECPDR